MNRSIYDDRLFNVWKIAQVFNVDEIVDNYSYLTHPCQDNQCYLPACYKWLYKQAGEVWYLCRDCQEREFNLEFEKTSIDVAIDENHMAYINRYCSDRKLEVGNTSK